jgi:hypothetical protein
MAMPLRLTLLAFKRADPKIVTFVLFIALINLALFATAADACRLGALFLGFLIGTVPLGSATEPRF